ncbi:hypothetical protein SLA2020_025290 [Shorea laevis]
MKLLPYYQYLDSQTKKFRFISFEYMPRSKNQFADALATLASMVQISDEDQIQPLKIDVHRNPAYCMEIGQEIDG